MLKLYHNPISTCSQKVRLALAEKGLRYEKHDIDFSAMEHLSDWYLLINPNGVVPTLVHNQNSIIDSSVICEFLDETFPDKPLTPPTALARAEMRAWMRFFEEVPTTAIRAPSFNMRFQAQLAQLEAGAFDAMTSRMPLRKQFYQEMGQAGFGQDKINASLERLRSCVVRVSNALQDGRDWILPDQFTIADIVLLPTIIRMIDLDLDHIWEDLPIFAAWIDRCMNRPSFVQAYYPGTRM